jgi:hypothetical protein
MIQEPIDNVLALVEIQQYAAETVSGPQEAVILVSAILEGPVFGKSLSQGIKGRRI